MIAILVDLFSNFGDFMAAGVSVGHIFQYYAVLLPTYWVYILPISLLLAVLYALWQLSKNSELIAMRACGLSIVRLITPYLVVGFVASLSLLAINERFNPWATYWTRQFVELLEKKKSDASYLAHNVSHNNPLARRDWSIRTLDPRPTSGYELRGINIMQHRPDGTLEYTMAAQRARWLDGHWWFEEVQIQYRDSHNVPRGPAEFYQSREMPMFTETPRNFLSEIKDSSDATEQSSAEILHFIDSHDLSEETANRLMVDFHSRLAMPWTCLIVILLGVPFGSKSSRRGMGMGIISALLIFFSYYALIVVCSAIGKKQLMAPVVAGWLPNCIFFALGVYLLRKMR